MNGNAYILYQENKQTNKKRVKRNETMFRRFGDIMMLSRSRKFNKNASSKGVEVLQICMNENS